MMPLRRPEDVLQAFQTAWNRHDLDAFRALFHEDVSFVNRFGHYVRGADAIIAMHAPIHATIYSDSTLANDLIAVDPVGADGAIVLFWSRLTVGAAHPAWGPRRRNSSDRSGRRSRTAVSPARTWSWRGASTARSATAI